MLGKVVLLAGAGVAYVLRTPEGRARVAQLLGRASQSSGAAGEGERAQGQLTSGQGGQAAGDRSGGRSRARRIPLPGRGSAPSGQTVPRLVDRRPEGSAVDAVPDELTGAHLLPDATPVEIARAVSEEQSQS